MHVRNIKELKIGLRLKYRNIRESMEKERQNSMDAAILKKLLALREYSRESVLFTYVSKEIEVDTLALISSAFQDKKKVAVPRCVPGTYDMEFYYIRSMEDLAPGMFGVLEPIAGKCEKVDDFTHGFCVVPGLCFDSQGYRLGYGKGYYDRFLSEFSGFTVGICYADCVQWKLPHGYFDRPVDILVTEKYIRKTARDNR